MSARNLQRIDAEAELRSAFGKALEIGFDTSDADRLKFKDRNGSVRDIVTLDDITGTQLGTQVDGLVRYAEGTLTSAQILSLFGTPITAIAAPGAGKVLVPLRVAVILDFVAAAYAGIAVGEDLALRYTNAAGVVAHTVEATGFLDQASDQIRTGAIDAGAAAAIVPVANSPLVWHMTTGDITTGDSPLRWKIWYSVFSTGL